MPSRKYASGRTHCLLQGARDPILKMLYAKARPLPLLDERITSLRDERYRQMASSLPLLPVGSKSAAIKEDKTSKGPLPEGPLKIVDESGSVPNPRASSFGVPGLPAARTMN